VTGFRLTGFRLTLLATLALVALAAALGAAAGGASARAVALAVIAGLVAALLGRGWLSRVLAEPVLALRRFAGAQREGQLDARLPGTWIGEFRPVADAVNAMADTVEARLRSSDARRSQLEAVIEAMEEAVLVVDADERVVLANPRLRELFASPGAAMPPEGRPLLEEVRHAEVVDTLRAALHKGETQLREASVGPVSDRRVRFQVAPFTQPDGSAGAVAVFHDVTDLRRVEAIRRDFVANASHELKTPLTSIRGYAERLADMKLPDHAGSAVEAIVVNARRLQSLVEDLLELSRIESGSVPLRPEPVDLPDLLRRLLRDLEPRLRAGTLALDVQAPADARVWADRRAVEQVLGNLLDNAIKYTAAGGRIEIQVRPGPGQRLQVSVADTGLGIPRKDLPRIFERFYRVDPGRSRALGGTGLGLAIVKHLVQAMGGQLGVESQLGQGTRFWVELPRPEGPLGQIAG
jgi:two-component system phosphate regulon sensor histidine kinase PhoR